MQAQRFTPALRLAFVLALLCFHVSHAVAQLQRVNYPSGFESQSIIPVLAGNKFFYPSRVAAAGIELVTADVNLANASLLKDIYQGTGTSSPSAISAVGNKVIFIADDGLTGRELYASDGTPAGTIRLTDYLVGAGSSFDFDTYSMSFGNYALVTRYGVGIYATDGTASGTRQVMKYPSHLFSINGRAVLLIDNLSQPDSVFLYDYATNTKTFLATLAPDYSVYSGRRPLNSVSFGNRFLLGFRTQILVSDGTEQGSFIVDQADGAPFSGATEFVVFDGKVHFSAYRPTVGQELFSLDLQTRRAHLELNLNMRNNGASSSDPESLTIYGDSLFFIADNGFIGSELYKFKAGSSALVGEIVPGMSGINGASVDSTYSGLVIAKGSSFSFGRSYIYQNGLLQLNPHDPVSFDGQENAVKRSIIREVPQLGVKLAVFQHATHTSSDSLVQLQKDGSLRYFSVNDPFNPMTSLSEFVVAGDNLYFESGYLNYLWRIGTDNFLPSSTRDLVNRKAGFFYPNPSSGRTLAYKGETPLEDVKIMDAQGRVCLKSKSVKPGEQINLRTQPAGLYFIHGKANGRRQTERIVLE